MTKHAIKRCQQRGIDEKFIDFIVNFGVKEKLPGGATGHLLTNKVRKRLVQKLDHLVGVQVVEGPEGTILTVYHRR